MHQQSVDTLLCKVPRQQRKACEQVSLKQRMTQSRDRQPEVAAHPAWEGGLCTCLFWEVMPADVHRQGRRGEASPQTPWCAISALACHGMSAVGRESSRGKMMKEPQVWIRSCG